ncbi:MAG: hypothetical protein ACYC7E_00285 [Armatimonadota bacterium]
MLLLLLLAAGGVGWCQQTRPNLLANGGFDDGLTGWTVAVNDVSKTGAAAVPDGAQTKAGAQSLKCTIAARCQISLTSAKTAVESGRDYLFTCWQRSEGYGKEEKCLPRPSYALTWLGADGKTVGSVSGLMPYQADPNWKITIRLFTVPALATAVQVSYYLGADNGTPLKNLWLDQVQLRRWDGAIKPDGKSWRYDAWDGHYMTTINRVAADDMTKSGLAVIANTRFVKQPTYLSAFLYLRELPPGTYRAIHRIKVAAPPPEGRVLTLGSEYGAGGTPNSRDVMSGEFKQANVYQDFTVRFVVTPWTGYVGLGAFWYATVTAWEDTITIFEEETYSNEQITALFN